MTFSGVFIINFEHILKISTADFEQVNVGCVIAAAFLCYKDSLYIYIYIYK